MSADVPPLDPAAPREALTDYRLPVTGRIVAVRVADAPPTIRYEVAPGHVVVAIRADLREPW
jgi:hypothetical protein